MSNRKIRVLFHYMIGGTAGGSDTCLYLLLKYLDQSKHEIFLLYKDRSKFVDDLESKGINLIQIYNETKKTDIRGNDDIIILKRSGKLRTFVGGLKRLYSNRNKIKLVMDIIDEYKIDVVHGNHYLRGDRYALIAALLKRKVVVSHNRGLYPPDIIDRLVAKKIDAMICMSNFSKNVYTDNGISDKNCKTIYDGIEIDDKNEKVEETDLIRIGCYGRLEGWKGQKTLVDAVELIVKKYNNLIVYLVGNGPSEDELKERVREKGLEKHIEFTGHITNVKEHMNSCSIIVHTSIEPEPFGMVITEAMALGKPVIATNFGGPVEIIENERSGFLIPSNDPNILSEKIINLMENKEQRQKIGEGATERVREKFDVRKYARLIENEYQELLK